MNETRDATKIRTSRLVHTALMAAMTAIGAYIAIPLPISPVPVTLQNLFVLLAGILLGARLGFMSQIIYLGIGLAGLPVFAGGTAGIGVLLSPTGGYLLAFPLAAYAAGVISEKSILKNLAACAAGVSTIYSLGVLFMILFWEFELSGALSAGVVPFIPGDLLKMTAAVVLTANLPSALLKRLNVTSG
ncbi:biotin transporter BioY [Halarsenatibacter silvermanii]|uniref:Biotin transporter n=1 Tax=Halarsenatibacter silvermanii TaxID=321763 RepID=A0A1G9KMH3_9FIRM|nr:biotin transporter BioY [Halarsenatibacter silvermanii]SDL50615.1 biotin transport system substrate-specific component [Halarsenatibacter silvermanii]